jgi:hypothetical protein
VALLLLVSGSVEATTVLDVGVSVDKAEYAPGESVHWMVTVATSATSGEVLEGIAGVSIYLDESTEDMLRLGQVDNTVWAANLGYITDNGSIDPLRSQVNRIEVFNLGLVGASTGRPDDGPLVLATGSYAVHELGAHTLTARIPIAEDQGFFDVPTLRGVSNFDTINLGMATFQVVPEPGASLAPLLLLGVLRTRRRRGATFIHGSY